MGRLIDSDITKIVAIIGGLKDITNPTVAELNAGIDITCAIVEGYTLGMQDSDRRNAKRSLCDKGNVEGRGAANYAGEFDFLREGDADETDSAYVKAAEVFADPDVVIDIVRRGGVPDAKSAKSHSEDFAADDRVDAFRFLTDYPQYRSGQDANEDATFHVKLMQQGVFAHDVAVVAGA